MKIIKLLIAILAITTCSGVILFAAERDAVVQFGGCTGFIVDGEFLVTARHCQHPETVTLSIQNQTVTARKVFTTTNEDGPVVFHLEGGPFESLKLADKMPETGDAVYSLGYPGGNWARLEGELIGGNGIDTNYTSHRIAGGNSGGPLLNARGEVIGVALHVDADLSVHRSGFASWSVTRNALAQAKKRISANREPARQRNIVVVFSTENCAPCQQLEQDVQAGHFDDYKFQFVYWDRKTKKWSEPELYREFWETAKPEADRLTFPTVWIKGTDRYRAGYRKTRRGGLLGWLAQAFRHLFQGILGREEESPELLPATPPLAEENAETEPGKTLEENSPMQQLLQNLQALREEILKTKADLETFKQSGVIGKIRSIALLKSDKKKTLEQVSKVKNDVDAIRREFREKPIQFLWGLFGLLSGLAQKRFLDQEF